MCIICERENERQNMCACVYVHNYVSKTVRKTAEMDRPMALQKTNYRTGQHLAEGENTQLMQYLSLSVSVAMLETVPA